LTRNASESMSLLGQTAPDFTLDADDGTQFCLSA
jgi:peroxiredoxin